MADATTPQTLLEGPYIPPSECVQPNSAEEGSAQHASEKGKRRRKTSVFSMNNRKFCKLIKSLSRDQVRPLYHARRLCACLCPRNGIRANLDDGKATQPFHLPTCSSWSGGVCESARLAHSPPRHVFPPTRKPNRIRRMLTSHHPENPHPNRPRRPGGSQRRSVGSDSRKSTRSRGKTRSTSCSGGTSTPEQCKSDERRAKNSGWWCTLR